MEISRSERIVNHDLVITLNEIMMTIKGTIVMQWYCFGSFQSIFITLKILTVITLRGVHYV